MPRGARKQSESGIYHIMIRGNEGKKLFHDDEDKFKFINILEEKKKDNNYLLYGFCLMDNHVHLLIKEEANKISTIMKKINTSYAYYFNKKNKRIGHVFQDRFKSEGIENESYLLAALRYIHNNPVKANMVKEPCYYKWSSYSLYLTKSENTNCLIDRDFILELFSKDKEKAVKMLIDFTNQPSEDTFIEYKEEKPKDAELIDIKSSKEFIQNYLLEKGLKLEELNKRPNIDLRNELIKELKSKSNLSLREISKILGISKDIVHRA